MHCASVGEFEQGRPIIERLKTLYPEYKILLTFFHHPATRLHKIIKEQTGFFTCRLMEASGQKIFGDSTTPPRHF
jgi:3-deoxy-D-manno-octulosonic-acid transferase